MRANRKNIKQAQRNKLIFYLSIMAIPVIQFVVFYICVNMNSFLLAFKEYNFTNGQIVEKFVGFVNLRETFAGLFTEELYLNCIKNSFMFYGISVLSGVVCSLAFSYYIYKKGLFGSFFKVMLYMPNIVSVMVICMMYKFFCNQGFPELVLNVFGKEITPFATDLDSQLKYIIFFNFLMSFGANMLVYTGTMSGISESLIEAAQIDGVNNFQEFFHIILPSIYQTFALFIATGMLTIFNGQANLYNFFGLEAASQHYTFGYYIYMKVTDAGVNYMKYPPLASLGLVLTAFAIPLIFSARYLLLRFGPKEE